MQPVIIVRAVLPCGGISRRLASDGSFEFVLLMASCLVMLEFVFEFEFVFELVFSSSNCSRL